MNYEEEDYSQKHVKNVFGRLIKYAFKHKKILFLAMLSMVCMACLDVVYPLFTRYAIDNFIVPQNTDGIIYFVMMFFLMVLGNAFLVYAFVSQGGRLENFISYSIRKDALTKLEKLSFSYYDTTPVGYIMARMVSDVSRLSEMISWSIIDVLWSIVYLAGAIVIMIGMNFRLTLIALSVLVPLAIVSYFFQKKILSLQRVVRKQNSKITASFNECIMGAVTTKILDREEPNADEFKANTKRMREISIKSARLSAFFTPIVLVLGSISAGLTLYQGGVLTADELISFGTLAIFVSYALNIFDPIQNIARIALEYQSAKAAGERVLSLIDEPLDIVDTPEVVEKYGDEFNPKTENWEPIKGDIELKNVSFSYKTGEQIFENFNLKIPAGKSLAIVGDTGAGKSTLVNLVCRFYEPNEGSVLIDGVDYRERSQLWLQRSLGYVLQTPHLFSGTIAENIAYSKPDASCEEIAAAARAINAHEFIERLENGYDTNVGEGGALLSTGQKQLVTFARVVLANPKIFILDEATSSVDTETEMLIQKAITTVLEDRTSLIIAHRLSTIRNSDRIIVVEKGKIIESGTHDELIKQNGKYFHLYNLQLQAQTTAKTISE